MKPKLTKPIAIWGMMGAGKSHVARLLAQELLIPAYDTDAYIQWTEGRSVQEIFSQSGEAYFRALEVQVIQEFIERGEMFILSLGGGAVLDARTRALLKSRAITIWLQADVDVILARIAGDTQRPLLQGDNPRGKIEELLAQREKFYALADIQCQNNTSDDLQILHDITQTIKQYLERS